MENVDHIQVFIPSVFSRAEAMTFENLQRVDTPHTPAAIHKQFSKPSRLPYTNAAKIIAGDKATMCQGKGRHALFKNFTAGSQQWGFFAADHGQTVKATKTGQLFDRYLAA